MRIMMDNNNSSPAAEWTLRLLPGLIVMAMIFFFSSRTGDDLNTLLPFFHTLFPAMAGFDWGHFVAYFVLGLAVLWGVTDGSFTLRDKLIAILISLLYGLTDEIHQLYVPGRMFDLKDLRNDGIGAAAAMLLVSLPPLTRFARKLRISIKFIK